MSNVRHGAHSARLGVAQVCAAGVLWGTGGLVVSVLHEREGLGAMTVSAWRMLLAAAALLAFAAATRHLGATVALWRAQMVRTTLVGCGTAAYQALYFAAVLTVGVSVATVVSLGLAPLLAAAWEHARAGSRPSRRQVLVLGMAVGGLVLISVSAGHPASAPSGRPVAGLCLAVLAGAVYAATTVAGHSMAQRGTPIALTTVATSMGAVALAPFLAVTAWRGEPVGSSDPSSLLLLVYLGVATMALAYGLLYAGLRTTSGSAATVATLVEPLSAAALAAVLLGERLPAAGVVGGVLILAAVVALPAAHEAPAAM